MIDRAAGVSGFQLLRQYLDKEPTLLASEIKRVMHAGGVVWRIPPGFDGVDVAKARWSNLDFLGRGKARSVWEEHWSPDQGSFTWDAIGKVQIGQVGWEWLLVTAFAHPGELTQSPAAPDGAAGERILFTIEEAKQRFQVAPGSDWSYHDLHLAARLSALNFLRQHGLCVRMLFIYFYDEKARQDTSLPAPKVWQPVIAATERRLGLSGTSVLERRIYRMFLPVLGV